MHAAVADEPKNQRVTGFENVALFDTESSQRIDVEETAVIHVARGDTPISQSIDLLFKKSVKLLETFGPVFDAVQNFDGALDRPEQSRLAVGGVGQPSLYVLAARRKLRAPSRRGFRAHAAQFPNDCQHSATD